MQVSSLSLPLAKLVAVYEQLVLELLEMRELDVARYGAVGRGLLARIASIDRSSDAAY